MLAVMRGRAYILFYRFGVVVPGLELSLEPSNDHIGQFLQRARLDGGFGPEQSGIRTASDR